MSRRIYLGSKHPLTALHAALKSERSSAVSVLAKAANVHRTTITRWLKTPESCTLKRAELEKIALELGFRFAGIRPQDRFRLKQAMQDIRLRFRESGIFDTASLAMLIGTVDQLLYNEGYKGRYVIDRGGDHPCYGGTWSLSKFEPGMHMLPLVVIEFNFDPYRVELAMELKIGGNLSPEFSSEVSARQVRALLSVLRRTVIIPDNASLESTAPYERHTPSRATRTSFPSFESGTSSPRIRVGNSERGSGGNYERAYPGSSPFYSGVDTFPTQSGSARDALD